MGEASAVTAATLRQMASQTHRSLQDKILLADALSRLDALNDLSDETPVNTEQNPQKVAA